MLEQFTAWAKDGHIAALMSMPWVWPWSETIHFIGMSLLFGSIMIMDLRLMGFMRKEISLHAVHALTPWGLLGFLLNLVTGVGFVMRDSDRYFPNPDFWFKMICVLLAGVNFLVFWFVIRKQLDRLPDDADVSISAKAVGASSLVLWTAVMWGGRMLPVFGVG